MTKKRQLWNAMLPLMIVLLISIITVMSYILIVSRSVWNQSVADILEVTEQGRHAFDTYLSKESELIHYLSLQYSQLDSSDADSIQSNIKSLSELHPDYFVIDLDSEKVYSNHYDDLPGLKKRNLDKYSMEQGCIINQPQDSDFTGMRVLSCYEVFRFADGTKAIIQSEHRLTDIVEEFSLSFYDGAGFSNIINIDGKILIRSDNINNNRTFNNIFDIIDRAGNDAEDLQRFQNSLNDRECGAIRFNGQDGEKYVYTYVPLTVEKLSGWYYVSIIPNSVIMQYTRKVLITPELIGVSALLCLIIIAVVIIEILMHNKIIARKEKESEFLMTFMTDLSENTSAVFVMLDSKDYSVEYVSRNTERMLGVPSKSLKTDLFALDADGYTEGSAINFDLFNQVTTDNPVSFDITRVHSISGEVLHLKETIYRITGNDTEHLLIVISERKRRIRT